MLSSPLLRARRTAELAGAGSPELVDDLREWDYGDDEGLTTAQIREVTAGLDGLARRPAGRRDVRRRSVPAPTG